MAVEESEAAGGGTAGLKGYEYQVDVSVWAALDLVLAKRIADAIVLEPCSQEDLEAELQPFDPGNVAVDVDTGEKLLVIQVKSRSTAPWDWQAILKLLKHGGERRISAKDRLKNPKIHYLLVTDAAMVGVASGLRTRSFGLWPKPSAMPSRLAKELHADSAGRVGVLDNKDEWRITMEIKELLTGAFRVPQPQWEACRKALRDEARLRMIGSLPQRWTRAQLEAVIKKFDGYFASSPLLASYVHPTNWAAMCEQLMSKHAIVIAGASGTGKTLTSEALWDFASKQVPGLTRVHVDSGPSKIRTTQPTMPVLFDIEDPWGRYRFEPDSEEWSDKLPDFLGTARADRLFVVTTRSDVLHDAAAANLVKQWRLPLESEHYGSQERLALYNSRMRELRSDLRSLALSNRQSVLKELETPLEIQKFFDALATNEDGSPRERIQQAVRDAHRDSIHRTVAKQVAERNATHWGVVIWGMLKAVSKLSRNRMPEVQDKLYEMDPMYESGLEQLLNFFVAGRNLRQVESAVSYYHPKVEQGLEAVVVENRLQSCRVLGHVADALVSLDDDTTNAWGQEACANLLMAANKVNSLRFRCPARPQEAVDVWLSKILLSPEVDFEHYLRLAAGAGSSNCISAEIARSLLHRTGSPRMFYGWVPITDDPQWYERVAAHPATRIICERFVRSTLPDGRIGDYPVELVAHLEKMAGDLSAAFIDAATSIVRHGYNQNADCIVSGAVRNPTAFEAVAVAALSYWSDVVSDMSEWRETHLKIKNGAYSEDYADHLSESAGEEGHSADVLLQAYTKRIRQTSGWTALASHPQASRLLHWWLDALQKESLDPPASVNEVVAVGQLALNSDEEERLWWLLESKWQSEFNDSLISRLVDGHANTGVRQGAASCFVLHAAERIPLVVKALLEQGNVVRLVGLFEDLAASDRRKDWPERARFVQASLEHVPAAYRELVAPFTVVENARVWELGRDATAIAQRLEPMDDAGHLARLRFGLANQFSVESDLQWLLNTTDDVDAAVAAIEGAITCELHDMIRSGLCHRFARVRAHALKAVVKSNHGEIESALLEMADDEGRYVREALTELIASMPRTEHLNTLIKLAGDSWTKWSGHYGGSMNLPIARTASQALLDLESIPGEMIETILDLAKETQDETVRLNLMRALVKNGPSKAGELLTQLIQTPGRLELRSTACWALISELESVEESHIASIGTEYLRRVPVSVAALVTILIGSKSSPAAIKAAAALLTATPDRKVLILLLAVACSDEVIASSLLESLPIDHPGRALVQQPNLVLPRDAITDLGDTEAVSEVLELLSDRFASPPKRQNLLSVRQKKS